MGFPVSYPDVCVPNIFLHTFSVLCLIRTLISSLFRFLGFSDLLESEFVFSQTTTQLPTRAPPVSAVLIREILPVVKFESLADAPESCAVCLHEFETGEEIRWLSNCKHVFHSGCLDRWMDCDQRTCPLCRSKFVPDDMTEEFNLRLRAATAAAAAASAGW